MAKTDKGLMPQSISTLCNVSLQDSRVEIREGQTLDLHLDSASQADIGNDMDLF